MFRFRPIATPQRFSSVPGSGFENSTDAVGIGCDRETDTQICSCGENAQQIDVANDHGTTGLDHEYLGRIAGDGFEEIGHQANRGFGGLVRIAER